jgi:glycosyl hydrolase family 18 (putative chitinase)
MRFSTYLLAFSLVTGVTACSGTGGSDRDVSAAGNAGRGGSANAAGNTASSGGSAASQAGLSSSLGGMSATAGGSGGASTAGGASSSALGGGSGGGSALSGGAQVLTWVPPYHVSEAKQMLSANFGTLTAGDGLSQLALQFWVTNGGSLTLDSVSEADITWFHDWARQHGVQILLCVDNYVGDGWNWAEAERSFKDNGVAFVASIVSEIAKRDFDGVNVDLEGIVTASADDQTAYTQLAQNLATALHPLGKVVTVDSFHGQWNAPNWNWWPDLLPIVDGITTMGYEQSGLAVDYQTLTDHSMPSPQKLTLGVPGYQDTWQGNTVTDQLAWIVNQGQIGVSIWDASFGAPGWNAQDVWAQLKTIKAR